MNTVNDGGRQSAVAGFWKALQIVLLFPALLMCAPSSTESAHFSAIMPMGGDSILLQPANQRLNMLLSLECKQMEELVVSGAGLQRSVRDTDGKPVHFYPSEISFRFTIGSRTAADDVTPLRVDTSDSVDRFQSSLRFQLKIFHGLEAKTLEPSEVKMIGVPADVPFDERVYHFTFNLPRVPVQNRMMLLVLDAAGHRVAKFHMQLL